MSEQWYWQHGCELRGPLDTASLELLIVQHRIGDHDRVRLADNETWLSGAEVKRLFSGGERTASSSAAAARLLSQARQLHAPATEVEAHPGVPLHYFGKLLRRVFRSAGGPVERIGDGLEVGLRSALRYAWWLPGLAVLTVACLVAMSLQFDSESRYRQVHAQLAAMRQSLDGLRVGRSTADERRAFVDAQRPVLERELELLIRDSQRAPGRSADSLAWLYSEEHNWNAAHTRNALIHASQTLRSLLRHAPDAELPGARVALFQQHMAIATERLSSQPNTLTQLPTMAGRSDSLADRTGLLLAAVLTLDAVLILAGVRYWQRQRR